MARDFRHDTESEPNMRTSSPVSKLVERLETTSAKWGSEEDPGDWWQYQLDHHEAASTLTALSTRNAELEREVKRLREAVNAVTETGRIMSGGIRRPAKYIRIDAAAFSLCYALSTSHQGADHD